MGRRFAADSMMRRDVRDGQRVGPAAWTPAELGSKLVLDLNSDLGITIGTGVSQWSDQSTYGNHMTQAVAASQMAYVPSALDGHAVLRADGVDDFLTRDATFTGLAAGDKPYIYTVYDPLYASGNYSGNVWTLDATGVESTSQIHELLHNAANMTLRRSTTLIAVAEGGLTPRLVTARWEAATFALDVNNVEIGSAAGVGLATTPLYYRVGARFDGALRGNYDYARILMVMAPTALEHTLVIAYLKAQYPSLGLP